MSSDLIVNERLVIPGADLVTTAVTSSGPGGQNVNKVATKVELRFDLEGTTALHPAVKARLRDLCRGRLDADGRIVLTSQATRNRIRNLADARLKLVALIEEALVPPKPRHATRPTRSSQVRRVDEKKRRAATKRNRGGPVDSD
jgi:ribosome-associated protein